MEGELQGKLDDGELGQITDVAHKTASLLASGDDDEKLSKIQAALQSAGHKRAKELDAQREVLRALARQYEAQKAATVRPASVPTEEQHQERLSALDARKLQYAKQIANLEQDTANAENKLSFVKDQVHQSHGQDPLAASPSLGDNGELLRLTLYRALGFTPVQNEQGDYVKILAASADKPEVTSFAFRPISECAQPPQQHLKAPLDDFVKTNQLWDAAF